MTNKKQETRAHLHSVPPGPPAVTVRAAHADDALVAEALRLAPREVTALRGEPRRIYHNVVVGLAAVQAERAAFDAAGVPVAWPQLEALPAIAMAYCRAADRLRAMPVAGKTRPLWAEFWKLRGKLLRAAETFVDDGIVPAERLTALRRANDGADRAGDLHTLAALFEEFSDNIAGRTTVTAADLARAEALSESLIVAARPRGARKAAPAAAVVDARRVRDALGWLLASRHTALLAAAGWRWGNALSKHVPTLTSYHGGRRAALAAAAPANTVTPAHDAHTPDALTGTG